MVGSPSFSNKNDTLHLIAGFNNIQNILTNQIVPAHIHCIEKRELSAQPQEGVGNCPTQKSIVPSPIFPLPAVEPKTASTYISFFLAPPPPHMREHYSVLDPCARRSKT